MTAPDEIVRTLADVRSDLRGAIALAPSVNQKHRERFASLLKEAQSMASPDQWRDLRQELSISDELLWNYTK
jgi:hypothetical protein